MCMLSARFPLPLLLGEAREDPRKFRSQDMVGKTRSTVHISFRVYLVSGPFPLLLNSHKVMKCFYCMLQML